MQITDYQAYGKDLKQIFKLPTMPVAVRFFEKEEDVPEGVIFPMRDLGKHMAFCQAVTCARKAGTAIALRKEDEWCWNPLVGFGRVSCKPGEAAFDEIVKVLGIDDRQKAEEFLDNFPKLELGKYAVTALAPLEKTPFEPDVVLIYGLPGTVNRMFLLEKAMTGKHIHSIFDGIDSCIYSTVPSFLTGECRVTFPDPGDQERAGAGQDEVIFTLPRERLTPFVERARAGARFTPPPAAIPPELELDFARPPFYNALYEIWGLDKGKDWSFG